MADGRDLLLGPGGLAGFTVHLQAEPNPGTRRLMGWLGVEIEVRPVSDAPVDHVRRPGPRGRTMGHYDAGYELPAAAAGKPDWIDYRASVGRAERRLEVGELVSRCWSCKTELDVTVPVHSPRCRRNGTDGREALDAMDGLVTQAELLDDQADDEDDEVDEELEDEPTYPGQFETSDSSTTDEVPKPEEEVETVRGGVVKWTREQIIEAIHVFHAQRGRPPKADDWIKSAPPNFPRQPTLSQAEYDEVRPKRGGVAGNSNRSSVREPKAREAGGLLASPPPADVKQPVEAGDDAVVDESPSPVVAEAGSGTDEQFRNESGIEPVWFAHLPLDAAALETESERLQQQAFEIGNRASILTEIAEKLRETA